MTTTATRAAQPAATSTNAALRTAYARALELARGDSRRVRRVDATTYLVVNRPRTDKQ